MHEIVTQAKRCFQTGRKIKRTLMIETKIALRSMEQTRSSHARRHADAARLLYRGRSRRISRRFFHSLTHHLLHHHRMDGGIHLLLDNVTDRLRQF